MNKLKTHEELLEIVSRVKYLDWTFYVDAEHRLQIQFDAPDMITGEPQTQYCREWVLDRAMTETEIVSTCWNAVKAAIEHEARENFLYTPIEGRKPRPVFQPHIDVVELYNMIGFKRYLDMQEGEVTGEWVKPDLG